MCAFVSSAFSNVSFNLTASAGFPKSAAAWVPSDSCRAAAHNSATSWWCIAAGDGTFLSGAVSEGGGAMCSGPSGVMELTGTVACVTSAEEICIAGAGGGVGARGGCKFAGGCSAGERVADAGTEGGNTGVSTSAGVADASAS